MPNKKFKHLGSHQMIRVVGIMCSNLVLDSQKLQINKTVK